MQESLLHDLSSKVSSETTVSLKAPARWSTFKAPKPHIVVNVGCEADVAVTVKFCNAHDLPFVAQNGGSGWATFPETERLVMINLSRLNTIVVASDKKTALIGGGAKIEEVISAADAVGVVVFTGNCNCVGLLGALLGGGFGNLMGELNQHGVDSILEMRVVTPDGELRIVNETQHSDLFWAMRGAGPNFGIVTSAVIKAHAMSKAERSAWSGALIYTDDKLEQVVQAIAELELSPRMVAFMYFASSGPPTHTPMIVVTLWLFQGTPEIGRAAFKSLYDIGPGIENTSVLPYPEWNTGGNPFCAPSERKPSFAAGINRLDPQTWRQVWNIYADFQKKPTAEASVVLLEVYPKLDLDCINTKSASFPHRHVHMNVAILTWYRDVRLDEDAVRCGREVRELLRTSAGLEQSTTYINFAHGDEKLEEIYGSSLARLRELKSIWDPEKRFNQWFPIR